MAQANPYPLRIEQSLMEKFKTVAAENDRLVNKEIEIMIKATVSGYEAASGEIEIQNQDG